MQRLAGMGTGHMDIVIDNGSGWIKAGFSGEDAPSVVEPAIMGRPRPGATGMGVCAGEAADSKRGLFTLEYRS
ncbi:hypothetical protein [Streptomyces sp. NPDC005283]|uniref:hypothetical protein n=1 Tax=Streptomyces sp. NPDC005283 TaxID=3156871 RepID=UPI00345192A7